MIIVIFFIYLFIFWVGVGRSYHRLDLSCLFFFQITTTQHHYINKMQNEQFDVVLLTRASLKPAKGGVLNTRDLSSSPSGTL